MTEVHSEGVSEKLFDPALRVATRWERTFRCDRAVILRAASHYIQEDAADEIVAAIKDWWTTTEASA